MSRNEDIDNAIWDDPEFECLSAHAALLYIWSWTNPRCGMAGIYKVSHAKMTESKVPLEHIPAALAELEAARFAFYEDQVLWVRSRVRRLRARSPQMAKSVAKDVQRINSGHVLRRRFLAEYASDPWLRDTLKGLSTDGRDTVSETPIGNPDSHTLSTPSPDGPLTGTGKGSSNGLEEKIELPEDFPRELRPHLRSVFKVLRDLARRHHAQAVSPLSLAAVVMARPHKPLVVSAYDFAAWSDSQAQRRKDVVAGYRNWLGKANDLAGFEQLRPDGLPAGNHSNVRPIRENASSMLRDLWPDEPDADPVVDAEVVEEDAA